MNMQDAENIAKIPEGFLLTQEKFRKILAAHVELCRCLTEEEVTGIFKVKEIRPENNREVWEAPSGAIFITAEYEGVLCFSTPSCVRGIDVSHVCDDAWSSDWTRLIPHVEDNSVERVEIEGIVWQSDPLSDTITPRGINLREFIRKHNLQNKPPMKMILEMQKESI